MPAKRQTPVKYPLTLDSLLDTAHMLTFLRPRRDSLSGSLEYGSWVVDASATLRSAGIMTAFTTAGTITADADAVGYFLRATSAAPQGSDAGFGSQVCVQTRHTCYLLIRFRLAIVDVRAFIGLSNNTLANSVDADNPTATHVIALQYSTDRPDTNFQFITKGGGAPTITDSGLAADAAIHHLLIAVDSATSVRCYIYSATLVQEALQTITATLPTNTQDLAVTLGLETRANPGAKAIDNFGAGIMRRIDV